MRTRKQIGGKIATPIRDMLDNSDFNGVIFKFENAKKVENGRYAALMLKHRNDYNYKTKKDGSDLLVYLPEADPFDLKAFTVDMAGK